MLITNGLYSLATSYFKMERRKRKEESFLDLFVCLFLFLILMIMFVNMLLKIKKMGIN